MDGDLLLNEKTVVALTKRKSVMQTCKSSNINAFKAINSINIIMNNM